MNSPDRIPLFPLNVVLFPSSRLPLHIFEERYRIMIRDCIAREIEFGINLTENRYMHTVGCTARVRSVDQTYDDGSFDIVVEGIRRYTLLEYSPSPVGYLVGSITSFEDTASSSSEELLGRVRDRFTDLLDVVDTEHADRETSRVLGSDRPASFAIAEKVGLNLPQRQKMLELRTENERLEALAEHLDRIIPNVKKAQLARVLAANDGYLPPEASDDAA